MTPSGRAPGRLAWALRGRAHGHRCRAPLATPARSPLRRRERGAVTAELALGLPLLLALTVALVWLLAVGAAQVRVVDGARETARMLARGDAESAAVGRGRRVAGPGSRVRVQLRGDEVAVTVSRPFDGPGGVLEVLPSVRLEAVAVAATEDTGDG